MKRENKTRFGLGWMKNRKSWPAPFVFKTENINRSRWQRRKINEKKYSIGLPHLFCVIFSLVPVISKADEVDFKLNTVTAYAVVEKKATYENYEGKFSEKKPTWAQEQFSGQKIFIKPVNEILFQVLYDDLPIKGKYEPINGLIFSLDQKVAITFGSFQKKSGLNLIDTQGQIYKEIDFSNGFFEAVRPYESGFVVLFQKRSSTNLSENQLLLSCFDYSGNEIWKKNFPDGYISWHSPKLLSVSPNGDFVVFGCQKKNGKVLDGLTYVLNGKGDVLSMFNTEYQVVLGNDNETAVLVNRKHIQIVDLKTKTSFFKMDLDESSKDLYGLAESDRNDKVVVTHGTNNQIDEFLVFDLNNKAITRFDAGSKDWGTSRVYYSSSENKVVIKKFNLNQYGSCEAFDLEK